jgi:protein SCO1/2
MELAFHPHPGVRLPLATQFLDEEGNTVALGDYFTRSPVVLLLDYLRCTSLCGVTLRNLVAKALDPLSLEPGRDYQLVSISIDPRDTPADAAAARAKYAGLLDHPGRETGIHFLTGTRRAAQAVADIVGFPYRYDRFLDAYIHPAGFVIAAPDGAISRYIEGVAISPPELLDALGSAELGNSQGPLTRLLLLCHIQGTPLGRFTAPILVTFIIADLAAGLTALAAFIAIGRRRNG